MALAVLVATGAAMAAHDDLWDSRTLRLKLAVLILVGVPVGLHVVIPKRRLLSAATLLLSLAVVWLGVELAHG